MFVVLLVESDVMDACTVGDEMRRLLFRVGEQRCGFAAGQRDGDERDVPVGRAERENAGSVRQGQPGHRGDGIVRRAIGRVGFGVVVQTVGHR